MKGAKLTRAKCNQNSAKVKKFQKRQIWEKEGLRRNNGTTKT